VRAAPAAAIQLAILGTANAVVAGSTARANQGAAATSGAADATDRPPSLEAMMARLAEAEGVAAHFVEHKHLALLQEPLESDGMLYFSPPDRLARLTERPTPARLVIHGSHLTLADANGVDRIDLDRSRIARQFVDQLTLLLAGDLDGLRASYSVSFEVTPEEGWRLQLAPRSRALKRMIEAIAVRGRGSELQRMEVLETSGDRSVTVFDRVDTHRIFSTREMTEIFSIEERLPDG
jgi:outer membrane lipoprotein-sorting protein